MFENITKGVWSIDENRVKVNKHGSTVYPLRVEDGKLNQTNVVRSYEIEPDRSNAEFIAFAFNLQQRFDISKLEELVQALQLAQSHINIFTPSNMKNPELNQLIKELLNQIKK